MCLQYCPALFEICLTMSTRSVGLCLAPDYRCSDGRCISSNNVCDGEFDCISGEDEENCQCKCEILIVL